MRKHKGFSLIELLIVVAIILIIAAIAIPNLIKSKMAANEASAVGAVRTVVTSEITYSTVNPTTGYVSLTNLNAAGLIDSVLGGGVKSGYNFAVTAAGATPTTFVMGAAPVTVGTTGQRLFCGDQTGVLRQDPNAGSATAAPTTCVFTTPL